MKKLKTNIYLILLILLTLPLVSAWGDESLIKSKITVKWDKDELNSGRFIIQGENLDWSKTVYYNNTYDNSTNQTKGLPDSWVEELELIMIRALGNYTDAQYAIVECNAMSNFSVRWEDCINQRTKLELEMLNQMVNKTFLEDIENNFTKKIDKLEKERNNLKTENDKKAEEIQELNTWNSRWKVVGLVGFGVSLYFLNKYKGWFKRKQQEETELPKDTPL